MSLERIPGLDAWITRDPREDEEHHPLCPQHEDASPLCVCGVPISGHLTRPDCDYIGGNPDDEPDCKCDELDAADACDAADARRDAERDR